MGDTLRDVVVDIALRDRVGVGVSAVIHQRDERRLAVGDSVPVGIAKAAAQFHGIARVDLVLRGRKQQARHEAHEFERTGDDGGLVEIVQVKVDEPVVSLVSAEIFQVQVAACEHARRGPENRFARQSGVEEVAGAAEKRERIGDWEGDTIRPVAGSQVGLLTLVERKTRVVRMALLPDRSAATLNASSRCIFRVIMTKATLPRSPDPRRPLG